LVNIIIYKKIDYSNYYIFKVTMFTVRKINPVAYWNWDICVENCAICRNSIHEPSISYSADHSDEDGIMAAFGTCGHVFHLDCIKSWIRTRNVCPLCNHDWNYSKMEKIASN
tara:strand:- start:33 stop:368 length:336 start_codon:yes stop_codon:yes gene_type:complete